MSDIVNSQDSVVSGAAEVVDASAGVMSRAFHTATAAAGGVYTGFQNMKTSYQQRVDEAKAKNEERLNKMMSILNVQPTAEAAKANGVNYEFF